MVGVDAMGFPRLNMMSFWTICTASPILVASFFVPGGAAAAGWTGYAPLSADPQFTGVNWGINLWLVALALEFASFLMGGVNILTTAINMRALGLTLMRLPLMLWMRGVSLLPFAVVLGILVVARRMRRRFATPSRDAG